MSYSINPMTEEELNAFPILENGTYDFQVSRADKQTSKSGNPIAKLQLIVWDKNGKSTIIFDYLVFSTVKFCVRKIRHFCKATGILEDFEKGSIREELDGLCGKVNIGIQESMPRPEDKGGGFYPAKNVVLDYVIEENAQPAVAQKQGEEPFLNEDIPF